MNPENQTTSEADFDLEGLVAALEKHFNDLLDAGAAASDPVRCRLVENLLKRYQQKPSRYLLGRLQHTLTDLEERNKNAAQAAGKDHNKIAESQPELADTAQALFQQGQWQALKHLAIRAGSRSNSQAELLRTLKEQVVRGELVNPLLSGNLSFDDFLMSQEQEILDAVRQENGGEALESSNASGAEPMGELRSIKHFRESWVKHNSEKLLAQAIADCPKDAGPLNSHRLAIQSLTAMRELSPEYLNRFLSYLETLLWLEKAGEAIGLSPRGKGKKPGASR